MTKTLLGYGSFGLCITPPISTNKLIVTELKKYNNKSTNDVGKIFKYNSLFGDHEDYITTWITNNDDSDTKERLLDNLKLLNELGVELTKKQLEVFLSLVIKDNKVRSSVIEFMNELVMYSIVKNIDPHNTFTPKIKGINIVSLDNNKEIIEDLLTDDICDIDDYDIELQRLFPQIIMENCGNNIRNIKIDFKDCIGQIITLIEGVKKLNDSGYIHRDIKTGNVLYNSTKFSLIDYGLMIDKDSLYSTKGRDRLSYIYKYYPPEYQVIALFNSDFTSYSSLLSVLLDDEDLVKEENEKHKKNYKNLYNAWFKNLSKMYNIILDDDNNAIVDESTACKLLTQYFKDFILQIAKKYKTNKYTDTQSLFEDCIDKTDLYSLGMVLYNMKDSLIMKDSVKKFYIDVCFYMIIPNPYLRQSLDIIIKIFRHLENKIDAY